MDRISIHCLDLAITVYKLSWQDQQAGGTLFDSKVLTSTNSSATVVEEFGQNSGFHNYTFCTDHVICHCIPLNHPLDGFLEQNSSARMSECQATPNDRLHQSEKSGE